MTTILEDLGTLLPYPLSQIFNQSILQGVFPNCMKLAEVIPLYKGKEHELIINYQPISLLMMMSKLLEKNHLQKNVFISQTQWHSI